MPHPHIPAQDIDIYAVDPSFIGIETVFCDEDGAPSFRDRRSLLDLLIAFVGLNRFVDEDAA